LDDDPLVWEESGLQGRYANCFRVGHNAFEFMLDFAQSASDNRVAKVHTRIIINPVYARSFLELLRDAIEQHERSFGRVVGREKT